MICTSRNPVSHTIKHLNDWSFHFLSGFGVSWQDLYDVKCFQHGYPVEPELRGNVNVYGEKRNNCPYVEHVEVFYDKSPSFYRQPAHLQHFETKHVFPNLLNRVNSKPLKGKSAVCLPGFAAWVSVRDCGWLLPPTVTFPPVHSCLGLTHMWQLYVALWHLFYCFHILFLVFHM